MAQTLSLDDVVSAAIANCSDPVYALQHLETIYAPFHDVPAVREVRAAVEEFCQASAGDDPGGSAYAVLLRTCQDILATKRAVAGSAAPDGSAKSPEVLWCDPGGPDGLGALDPPAPGGVVEFLSAGSCSEVDEALQAIDTILAGEAEVGTMAFPAALHVVWEHGAAESLAEISGPSWDALVDRLVALLGCDRPPEYLPGLLSQVFDAAEGVARKELLEQLLAAAPSSAVVDLVARLAGRLPACWAALTEEEVGDVLHQLLDWAAAHFELLAAVDPLATWLEAWPVRPAAVQHLARLAQKRRDRVEKLMAAVPNSHAIGILTVILPLAVGTYFTGEEDRPEAVLTADVAQCLWAAALRTSPVLPAAAQAAIAEAFYQCRHHLHRRVALCAALLTEATAHLREGCSPESALQLCLAVLPAAEELGAGLAELDSWLAAALLASPSPMELDFAALALPQAAPQLPETLQAVVVRCRAGAPPPFFRALVAASLHTQGWAVVNQSLHAGGAAAISGPSLLPWIVAASAGADALHRLTGPTGPPALPARFSPTAARLLQRWAAVSSLLPVGLSEAAGALLPVPAPADRTPLEALVDGDADSSSSLWAAVYQAAFVAEQPYRSEGDAAAVLKNAWSEVRRLYESTGGTFSARSVHQLLSLVLCGALAGAGGAVFLTSDGAAVRALLADLPGTGAVTGLLGAILASCAATAGGALDSWRAPAVLAALLGILVDGDESAEPVEALAAALESLRHQQGGSFEAAAQEPPLTACEALFDDGPRRVALVLTQRYPDLERRLAQCGTDAGWLCRVAVVHWCRGGLPAGRLSAQHFLEEGLEGWAGWVASLLKDLLAASWAHVGAETPAFARAALAPTMWLLLCGGGTFRDVSDGPPTRT